MPLRSSLHALAALALLVGLATPAFAQPVVNGTVTDADYTTIGTKPNGNAGFGPINVQTLRYFADTDNEVLYLAAEGVLNTGSGDAIGLMIGLSETTAAGAGTPIGNVSGVGSFFGGGRPTFTPDFDVDVALAVNPGGGNSSVFVDIAEFVGGFSGTYLGTTNQSGTSGTGSFNGSTITYAFNNAGGAGRGFEVAIPFSALGITGAAGSTIEGAAVVVAGSGYFSDVYVGGTVNAGNLGNSPNFSTNTRNGSSGGANPGGPIGTAPFHTAAAPVGPPFATGFAFVSPTAGQSYRAGGKLKPVWETTPPGAVGAVTVTLRKGGQGVVTLYAGPNLETPDFGDARYTIPVGMAGGTDYTVYIALDGNPAVNAESGAFEITAQPFVVSNPAGGELYSSGQTVSVTFGLGGLMAPRARIYLRSAAFGSELIATEEGSDGQVDVTIPSAPDGDDYRIVVRLNKGTTKLTARSNTFNIGSPIRILPFVSHFGTVAGDVGTEMWLDVAAPSLADGSEVGVFAGSVLVGTARVAGGYADVRVTGVADGTTLSLRSFADAAERTVETAAAVVFADGAETEVALKGGVAATSSALAVSAYPNPASSESTIRVSAPSSVAVYDVLGRLVADLGSVETDARWDASAASPGVYVIRATTATGATSVRVTVAR